MPGKQAAQRPTELTFRAASPLSTPRTEFTGQKAADIYIDEIEEIVKWRKDLLAAYEKLKPNLSAGTCGPLEWCAFDTAMTRILHIDSLVGAITTVSPGSHSASQEVAAINASDIQIPSTSAAPMAPATKGNTGAKATKRAKRARVATTIGNSARSILKVMKNSLLMDHTFLGASLGTLPQTINDIPKKSVAQLETVIISAARDYNASKKEKIQAAYQLGCVIAAARQRYAEFDTDCTYEIWLQATCKLVGYSERWTRKLESLAEFLKKYPKFLNCTTSLTELMNNQTKIEEYLADDKNTAEAAFWKQPS